MILCLDIGNTHIFGGVFSGKTLHLHFRYGTNEACTSDELGVFLKGVLHEDNIPATEIKSIAICSVVPAIDYSIRAACKKYFALEPFILKAGVKTGIKIMIRNPQETGADLIAGALAATESFPQKNLIVLDLGTATTITAVSAEKEFLGVVILPGIRLAVEALGSKAAKLFAVEIAKPQQITGRSTCESIQAGLYYGNIGAIKEIIKLMSAEVFADHQPIIISTGGFSSLFANEHIFDVIEPDLVLHGLRLAWEMNK
jgi:type III pantothenate kinase